MTARSLEVRISTGGQNYAGVRITPDGRKGGGPRFLPHYYIAAGIRTCVGRRRHAVGMDRIIPGHQWRGLGGAHLGHTGPEWRSMRGTVGHSESASVSPSHQVTVTKSPSHLQDIVFAILAMLILEEGVWMGVLI